MNLWHFCDNPTTYTECCISYREYYSIVMILSHFSGSSKNILNLYEFNILIVSKFCGNFVVTQSCCIPFRKY